MCGVRCLNVYMYMYTGVLHVHVHVYVHCVVVCHVYGINIKLPMGVRRNKMQVWQYPGKTRMVDMMQLNHTHVLYNHVHIHYFAYHSAPIIASLCLSDCYARPLTPVAS